METITLIILFGLVWGSFLNVVIYRLPRKINIVFPPSACPVCRKRIRPYDNIPILSYLILKGKCRYCKTPIPFSYFLVELLTPLSFLVLFSRYPLDISFFISCLFTSAMIVLAFIDLHHKILPDEITLPGIFLGLIYSAFRPDLSLKQALFGAVAGAVFLLFIYVVYLLLRKKEGLGMGDVTMLLFIGAFLGLKLTILTLMAASFSGALVGAVLICSRKEDLQFALPFGTFLAPAAFFSLVWGNQIINWYLNLFTRL
jgi:leader peptidase (prepilin peptidase)/N-methyltransferase